jgi:hypothetical protein
MAASAARAAAAGLTGASALYDHKNCQRRGGARGGGIFLLRREGGGVIPSGRGSVVANPRRRFHLGAPRTVTLRIIAAAAAAASATDASNSSSKSSSRNVRGDKTDATAADDDDAAADDDDGGDEGETFCVGCGTGDVTGAIDGVGLMGYAVPTQTSRGLWQRQWARAFVVSSPSPSSSNNTSTSRSFGDGREVAGSLATPTSSTSSSSSSSSSSSTAPLDPQSTVAVVVVDACMTFPDLKTAALEVVASRLAAAAARRAAAAAAAADESSRVDTSSFVSPYTEDNVLICVTHTHAAPGGYAPHGLYNVTLGVGFYKLSSVDTYGLKAHGFNH